jgi:hypothetical protein
VAENLSQCSWPTLAEPFATALRQAVSFVFEELQPIGVIATGTIVRGHSHRSSDLDVYVVHLGSYRRRIQRFFNGVLPRFSSIRHQRFERISLKRTGTAGG